MELIWRAIVAARSAQDGRGSERRRYGEYDVVQPGAMLDTIEVLGKGDPLRVLAVLLSHFCPFVGTCNARNN